MQLITLLSAATAMVAGVSARSAIELNMECNKNKPYARVVNRCDYPVYLWSVYKGTGCPDDAMVTLETGETYNENYESAHDGPTGVSIKISKQKQCKSTDIVQLEYYLETSQDPEYNYNYLDVSYVDCLGDNCPTKSEGYYLVAGNQTGKATASASNSWCPILSCTDAASCAKMSYILPDDVQTKTCNLDSSMDFYMCGGQAPGGESYEPAQSSSSSKQAASSTSKAASSTYKAASSTPVAAYSSSKSAPLSTKTHASTSTAAEDSYDSSAPTSTAAKDSYEPYTSVEVKVAAVSSAPAAYPHKTKTEVVYVTAYETVKAKRHAHDHAGRHQQFHA